MGTTASQMTGKKDKGWLWAAALGLATLGLAATIGDASDKHDKCEKFLVGNSSIIPSGRDADVIKIYEEDVKIVFGKDGIAQKLGLGLPPHQIEFVPSSELAVLATLGRHAVPHWYDGSRIATQAQGAAGVLEFVTPGCPTCRSFYSDVTSVDHQRSILLHVAGHNDFAYHSNYNKIRPSDAIADSLTLYERMGELYRKYDHDEVSQWYQHLLTLSHMQDIARGTFDSPEDLAFKPAGENEKLAHSAGGVNPYGSRKHPKRATPSVLQAIVANLPANAPAWKKDVALLFERMNRVIGYYASTKIMNEGWATLMQELMVPYSPWVSTHYSIEHAELLTGVAYPSLSNPYWLGRDCWRNLRNKFNSRPEIKGLEKLEQDRRFVDYAHTLIQTMNDYDFIRFALDDNWVAKHGLHLYRRAEWGEWDRDLPPPLDPTITNPEQKIVVSTDGKRVIDYLARRLADRSLHFPTVVLENFNAFGRNVVSLRHEVIDDLPLEKLSAAQSIFVMSRIMERPVSVSTLHVNNRSSFGGRFEVGIDVDADRRLFFPIRIEVEPNGKVTVYDLERNAVSPSLTAMCQEAVNAYHEDLDASTNADLVEAQMQQFLPKIASEVVHHSLGSSMHLASHSPTAAHALLEYSGMIDKRILRALEQLKKGLDPSKVRNNTIRLKVLPDVPEFALDQEAHEWLKAYRKSWPADHNSPQTAQGSTGQLSFSFLPSISINTEKLARSFGLRTDDDFDLGGGKGRKTGDRYWGNSDGRGGKGEGEEGEEDGGKKPGKGSKDPTEVEIPLSLYGELLKDELELPYLKPKPGLSDTTEQLREGGVHRPFGNVLWPRIVPKALALGQIAFSRKKGFDPRKKINRQTLLKEGLKHIQPSDYVVSDREPTPSPDINAVIVIYMDSTGSMMGEPIKRAKELTFNLKALLASKYKKLEFRYVAFDTVGKEFPEDKFFKIELGGGTNYASGLKKTKEILDGYNPAQWDRFSFGIGDAQDSGHAQNEEALREVLSVTQYSAFVRTQVGMDFDFGFWGLVQRIANEDPFFGVAEVDHRPQSSMDAMRKLFGKDRSKDAK